MATFLQDRDLRIFREISLCRFLTLNQIAKLCFEGRAEAAKKRLQKLQRGGFVVRHSPGILASSVYLLTRTGTKVLNTVEKDVVGAPPRKPPAITTLKHEIMLRDFRASIFEACLQEGITVEEFSIDSKALAFELPGGITRPDGYFVIKEQSGKISRFFVEIDNGTEPLPTIIRKVEAYRWFYKAGMFARKHEAGSKEYQLYPFRVFLVFSNETTRDTVLLKLQTIGTRGFVVACTIEYSKKNTKQHVVNSFHSDLFYMLSV